MNRRPKINLGIRVGIVCEGSEETEYLEALEKCNIFSNEYNIGLINARGNGSIFSMYQQAYQTDKFDVIFILCDTEKYPYEQYEQLKNNIDEFYGKENIAKEIIIYGNPCTMQIVLAHWTDEKLKSAGKGTNAELIQKYTSVVGYKGKAKQRAQLYEHITAANTEVMYERVKNMSNDDTVIGSSNFDILLDYITSEDTNWINEINSKLEE